MKQGGRPAVYLGAEMKFLRIRYFNMKGRTRGFYARWRKNLKRWECHLSGSGLKPRCWFSESQTMALHHLRMTPCLWNWRMVKMDKSVLWDGIPDTGYAVKGVGEQDLFAATLVDPQTEPATTLPATSQDRISSVEGSGALAPEVTIEQDVVDHDGLVVGSLPADQFERYFPVTSFKALSV